MQARLDIRHGTAPAAFQPLAPDRRSDVRLLAADRPVKVRHAGDEHLGRCRNLSDGGARLELQMELYLGDRISIAFSPHDVVNGRIVWIAGKDHGIEFDAPIDCLSLLGHARDRAAPRPTHLAADLAARAAYDGGTGRSVVSGLPVRRMKTACTPEFHPGLRVRVILGSGRESEGVVRWTRDNIAGVMLLDPLSVEELGSIKRLSLQDH